MSLKESIRDDMKSALRAGEKERLTTIRMLLAAIQRREVDDRTTLDDTAVLQIVEKLVKQGEESASQYASAGRDDLATKERGEIEVLRTYLPEPLTESELDALIGTVIDNTGADSIRDMGKVMNAIREQAQGRADMGKVGAAVKARLSG